MERQTLFDHMEEFVPNFKRVPMTRQFEILVYGYDYENMELKKINTKILTYKIQK